MEAGGGLAGGPGPGDRLAAGVLLSPLREAAWLAVLVNAFNLLPLGFLDGGRLLDGLLFQRHRALEVAFSALPAFALGGLALAFEDLVLGLLATLSLATISFAFRRATWAARLRGRLDGGDVAALPPEQPQLLYSAAGELGGAQAKPRTRAETMRQLHERATVPAASVAATIAFTGAWLAALVLAVAVAVAVVVAGRGP